MCTFARSLATRLDCSPWRRSQNSADVAVDEDGVAEPVRNDAAVPWQDVVVARLTQRFAHVRRFLARDGPGDEAARTKTVSISVSKACEAEVSMTGSSMGPSKESI